MGERVKGRNGETAKRPRSSRTGDFTVQRQQVALDVAEACHPQVTRRQRGDEKGSALEQDAPGHP